MYSVIIKIMDATAVPMKFNIDGKFLMPHQGVSYFGNKAISRKFTQNNPAPAQTAGIDGAGAYIEALVDFVGQFSGDRRVGGPVTVMTLDGKNGANWFRRPEFCPKELLEAKE